MMDQARFTIASLLEGKSAVVQITPVAADGGPPSASAGLQESKGLGFDIENIAALPDAEDYALHEFYRARFTPAEIAYCIRQPTVKTSFQGLLTSGQACHHKIRCGELFTGCAAEHQLGFDRDGRPTYTGCLLSISDTGTIAAAICCRGRSSTAAAAASESTGSRRARSCGHFR